MSVTIERAADTRGPFEREWPAWAVPVAGVGEWLALQLALAELTAAPVCAGDPELWWSTRATPASAADQAAAVEACGWCPVVGLCRTYAIAAGERFGVWGGTTPEERHRLSGSRQ